MSSTASSSAERPNSKKAFVEVDIGKLESYLTSIKGQLDRHEEELKNPIWWASFKAEIDQVAVMGKKVEHQALDINIIRDMLASQDAGSKGGKHAAAYSDYGAPPAKSVAEKKTDLLVADVEAIKLLVRRMEAQTAVEHSVFAQIRELQRVTRNINAMIEERAPPDALKTLMELVVSLQKIRPLFDSRLNAQEQAIKADVFKALPSIATEISNSVYALNRQKEKQCVLQAEYNVKTRKMDQYMVQVREELDAFIEESGLKSMAAGKRTINEVVKRRMTVRQRDLLTRWKQFTLMERDYAMRKQKLAMGKNLAIIHKAMKKMGLRNFFTVWTARIAMMRSWDLFRIRCTKMIDYWISRVKPDIKLWLLRWKSQTVLRRSQVEDNTTDLRKQIPAAQQQLRDLPEADLTSKIVVLGETVLKVAAAHNVAEDWIEEHKKSYVRMGLTIETNELKANTRIDSQCQAIMSNLSRHTDHAMKSFSTLTLRAEKNENFVSQEFTRVDEEAGKLSKKVKAMHDQLMQHEHKFERILLLQGEMLERLDSLEEKWSGISRKMTDCTSRSEEASESAETAMNTTAALNKDVKDSLYFYDEEFKSIRSAGKIAHKLIEETAFKHRDIMVKLNEMERGVNTRLDDADEMLQGVQPVKATPAELDEMCAEFELVAMMGHGAGREATDIIDEPHVCVPLAQFVMRLSKQMAETILKHDVEKVISGPRLAPPMSTGVAPEDRDYRAELMEEFNEEFVRLVRGRDDEPGYARAQARVVLHRRFMSAMKTALNSHLPKAMHVSSPNRQRSPDKIIGERIAQSITALSRSAAQLLDGRPLTSPNAPPPKWQPKINTDINIQKDDNRSTTDYDYYSMMMLEPVNNASIVQPGNDKFKLANTAPLPATDLEIHATPIPVSVPRQKSLLERQQAERSLSAGAVRHRTALIDSNSMSAIAAKAAQGPEDTMILAAAKSNRKVATALSAAFDPTKSIPYERSNEVDMESKFENPLQSRKLFSSNQ